MANATAESAKDRVRKHRDALRADGLRPVTRWVPDTRSAEFQKAYRAQVAALAESARNNPKREEEYWKWADATQSDDGWV